MFWFGPFYNAADFSLIEFIENETDKTYLEWHDVLIILDGLFVNFAHNVIVNFNIFCQVLGVMYVSSICSTKSYLNLLLSTARWQYEWHDSQDVICRL